MINKIQKLLICLVLGFTFIYAQVPIVDQKNNMRINKKTGVPIAIYNIQSKQYNGTPEQIARQYLKDNRNLLKMENNLEDLELIEVKKSPAGNHVSYRQNYRGIPVMSSEIVVSINHHNRIGMVINHHKTGISLNTTPYYGLEQSLNLAREATNSAEEKELFKPKVDLMVYEDSLNVFHLIWKVVVYPANKAAEWLVIIDAHSGKILEKYNMVFDYVIGTGRVFNPDPGTELNDETLLDLDDADYSALASAYDNVSLYDLNNAISGVYKIQGRYAHSCDIGYPYDSIEEETDKDDFTYNRSQNGFEEVNIYYFIDKQRRFLGTLGFSPTWKYLDPSGAEAFAFDARGETGRNAHYYPSSEYSTFGVPSGDVDAGEDQCLSLHEYGHALHDALINGGIDSRNSSTAGISEGIADYMAISYRRTTQGTPFRPNHRSNWFYPSAGITIKTAAEACYPTHWGSSQYDKMKVWASTLMDMEANSATDPSQGTNLGRNITTKLMLTSLSYVTSNSSVQDNVHAIMQADRDIPEYNGEHIQEIATIFNDRGFFYDDKVSGTISSNTTWENCVWINGDVTVANGVSLTIEEGTFLFFENNTQLTVNGLLNAQGTSSEPIIFNTASGTWDGLSLVNADNNSSLEYCEIKNATNGITVSNCDPQIRGCYIYDNTNHGIYVINGASPELQYNTIKNNDGSGIYNNGSSETFCEISGTGENDIMNNSGAGVYNNGGFVHLGPYMGAGTSYYNTISGNNGEINNSNGSVEAQKCYWGTSSPTYQLFLGSGITDWQNYLTSDQADGSPLAKNAGQNWEDIENNIDRNNPKELYMLANYLREQSRSDEAGSVFKDIIIRFPNSSVVKNSVRKLFLTERKLGKKYIIDYVKSLRNGKTLSHIDNALCEILLLEYVRQNDVNNVEKLGKEIIKNYSNRDSEKMALYNLSTYQGMGANNRIKYLDIMKTKYPNDPITLQALVLNGEDVDWTQQVDGLEKSISGNIETVAADFSLNPAYPNPFNPSTTISFSLSKQSKIDIQVYDLKGKKVWNWENNLEYGIGNHKVVWNAIDASGNSLSTGVYFIKLIAGEQVATQKVILMK